MNTCEKCGCHEIMNLEGFMEELAKAVGVSGMCKHCIFRAGTENLKSTVADASHSLSESSVLAIWGIASQLRERADAENDCAAGALARMACIGCGTVMKEKAS